MWYVWNRMVGSSGPYAWCEVPKQYKTKKAAHMAVRDKDSIERELHDLLNTLNVEVQFIALPEGMKPRHDMIYRLAEEFA